MRAAVVFLLLLAIKVLRPLFYRIEADWAGLKPPDPWANLRLAVFLNHTSLFEFLFLASLPIHILWQLASQGVIPAADKTIRRPLVGLFYRWIAQSVVPITRSRDRTWEQVLSEIGPRSLVVIAPEGRMMRRNGLDADGRKMSVRGGIADIIETMPDGRMILVYSGGLHHVQAPGEGLPRIFKTLRLRFENLGIAEYRQDMNEAATNTTFRDAVIADLEDRRDRLCPRA